MKFPRSPTYMVVVPLIRIFSRFFTSSMRIAGTVQGKGADHDRSLGKIQLIKRRRKGHRDLEGLQNGPPGRPNMPISTTVFTDNLFFWFINVVPPCTVFVLLSAARPDCKGRLCTRGIAATYGVFRQDPGTGCLRLADRVNKKSRTNKISPGP